MRDLNVTGIWIVHIRIKREVPEVTIGVQCLLDSTRLIKSMDLRLQKTDATYQPFVLRKILWSGVDIYIYARHRQCACALQLRLQSDVKTHTQNLLGMTHTTHRSFQEQKMTAPHAQFKVRPRPHRALCEDEGLYTSFLR